MHHVNPDTSRKLFFEIEFIDPIYCSIRHYDNTNLKFLTLNFANSAKLTFETRSAGSTEIEDTQIFMYALDESNNTISFLKQLSGGNGNTASLCVSARQGSTASNYYLSGGFTSAFDVGAPYNSDNTFDYQPTSIVQN